MILLRRPRTPAWFPWSVTMTRRRRLNDLLVMRQFLDDVWDQGDLPKTIKALIRHEVWNINDCFFCSAHPVHVLRNQVVVSEKIDNMHDFRSHPSVF